MSNYQVIAAINAKFHVAHDRLESIHHETTIPIEAHQLHEVVALLLEQMKITHLTTITAQVMEEPLDNLQVYYQFWHGEGLTLAIQLPAENPQLPSITDMIPGADFYEREVAEMFGIAFTGRKTTPPLLLPDDWDAEPPMRRKAGETNG